VSIWKLLDFKDGGYRSRKFVLAVFSMVIIASLCILSGFLPQLTAGLPTVIGGILGVLGIYFTGNVATKHVMGSALTKAGTIVPDIKVDLPKKD